MRTGTEHGRSRACAAAGFAPVLALSLALLAAPASVVAQDIVATVRDDAGQPLADAVVVAVPEQPVKLPAPKVEAIVQEQKQFRPAVKAVLVGTPVQFPNRDDVLHHVYSFSPPKVFEIQAYHGTPQDPVVFDRPGPVALGCNIHDWMVAHVYVSESPWFGATGPDGTVRLSKLPPGRYQVRVWHARLAAAESTTARPLTLGAGTTAELAWDLPLKRDLRVRRAPGASGSGYR